MRLMRLIRLFSASVGPLLTRAMWKLQILSDHLVQGPSELAELEGHRGPLEVLDQLREHRGRWHVAALVELAQSFF
jgi:hypothetical protein